MAVASPIPTIVGALQCQKDSYLKSFVTEVVSCEEYVPPTQKDAKSKNKKSKDAVPVPHNGETTPAKTYLVEFADSVLFPEGGGQPTDHGSLTPISTPQGDAIAITNIERHGLRCVHFSSEPLQPGTKVQQDVDFTRRWDHMQQHTGQHLLSAIMDSLDLPTLSWNMATAGEMNSIEIPRKPSDSELQTIQTRCNELIRDNLPITVETPDSVAGGAEKVPGDYDKEKGVVRFIKIGDLDYNACCGTHLKQTSHIGLILLHHMTTVRGTNCRLFFTAGDRAIRMATESINALRNIAVSMSSGSKSEEVQSSVQRLGDMNADARKREKKMLAEIAKYEGDRIKDVVRSGKSAWCYRATDGLDFINLVVFEIKEAISAGGIVVLASGEVKSAGSIVLAGEKGLVETMATKVKEVVSTAKGGGKGEKWQGKVTEWKKGEIEALKAAVEDA